MLQTIGVVHMDQLQKSLTHVDIRTALSCLNCPAVLLHCGIQRSELDKFETIVAGCELISGAFARVLCGFASPHGRGHVGTGSRGDDSHVGTLRHRRTSAEMFHSSAAVAIDLSPDNTPSPQHTVHHHLP